MIHGLPENLSWIGRWAPVVGLDRWLRRIDEPGDIRDLGRRRNAKNPDRGPSLSQPSGFWQELQEKK